MKIYLAGPMRGLPQWNFPAFKEAKKRLEAQGHHVFCPATMDEALGYGQYAGATTEEEKAQHLRHVMKNDINCLMHANAIALLPGWERSRGATVELALAQFLGLTVLCAITAEEILPEFCPWTLVTLLKTFEATRNVFNPPIQVKA